MAASEKPCRICGKVKPVTDFHVNRRNTDGRDSRCRDCKSVYDASRYASDHEHRARILDATRKYRAANPTRRRDWRLRQVYGISLQQYEAMIESQGFRCGICGTGSIGNEVSLYVDHDHSTSQVRGLLCNSCNAGLGFFRDDPSLLSRAISYLERGAEGVAPAA